MSIVEETRALRRELAELAAKPEWGLLTRYDLLRNKATKSMTDRIVRWSRRQLSTLGLLPPHVTKYRWQPGLKHAPHDENARALLIWALGVERKSLRAACEAIRERLQDNAKLAPVLVTDVADFAFYSRLGWLVEYLPELSGEGQSYRERKIRYLAWRYRDAVIVPPSVAWVSDVEWDTVLGDVAL